ncbi:MULTISPECIES: SLC45 family MFS transporter [Ligilactobacillus]|uniref:SLC45 family MFS transporter n=1 Tax=Ligilactobacillus salivarius TaxID=1624 RepID=A0AAW7N4S0_9LACO|nr:MULTISPECIES: SLC45 family MFS transporter [Ligilactobacillus]MCZ0744983.1 SLC45 family MFS transporter [Ligilactobacillus sp. UO.C109]MDM8284002.1 SLC45 family MFS transporter [Ligilactobacillus salivarius]MDN4833066.1 SLC45 family MFS transporter [Ligilactobacillus salivarius]MYU93453.1 SLC45 family MFS transporter [Ligilactobacillus salivarius]PHY95670.1 MFS transporter [Ligilactobacillus salivarius]
MSEKAQSSQATKGLPDVSKSLIWMINFGFLGVQTAFTLQSSQMSRIFQTLGADPNSLGWFFILPPLAGLLVQPVVGYYSDRTWAPKLGGRRLPYLLLGTLIAVIVMILLPNSGSFGFGYGSLAALLFGAITVAFLDVSSNMAMQPFKMMVGDMVNDDQKSYAYGIQSFLSNTGAVIAAVLPFLFAYMGLKNTAAKGVVPQTVVVAFYVGAALLIITSLFTIFKVKEYDPETYALYHGISTEANEEKVSWIQLLKTAPKAFWTVTLVQFFCWFAFQYLWTYSAGAIAENVWHTTNATSQGYQAAGNWYGVLAAVQSIAAVVWSYVLAKVPNKYHKAGYFSSLLLGALGFLSIFFVSNQYVLIVSYILVGIAWAGINTYPLTIVTNALSGNHMGTYLGLFNGSICLPQIVASLLSFGLFPLLGGHQANMFLAAGIVLALGAFSVLLIKETHEA